jgi:hypothetical protein
LGKKVVYVARHCCIRCIKEALALRELGYDLHLVTEKVTQFSDTAFKTMTVYHDMNQLYDSISLHPDAELFHVHNEPSFFVTAVKEVFNDKPVILDAHDSTVIRRTDKEVSERGGEGVYRISVDERNNFQLADAIVYVSDPMQEIVNSEFDIKVPTVVLPSYVPERFYRIDFKRWWGGLVYEGRIDTPTELTSEWDFFQYSNYLELGKKCGELGVDFHIYTPRKNDKVREEYSESCFLHDPLSFDRLIKELGGHDWGLVGNLKAHEEWKHALPNKLFEYLAACVPVVAINADESSRFLEKTGMGITVSSIEELCERWPEHREIRKRVIKDRMAYTMEKHIGIVDDLYKRFI